MFMRPMFFLIVIQMGFMYAKSPSIQQRVNQALVDDVAQLLDDQWQAAVSKEGLDEAIPAIAKYLANLDTHIVYQLQEVEDLFKTSNVADLEAFMRYPYHNHIYCKKTAAFLDGYSNACALCVTPFEYVRCFGNQKVLHYALNKEILDTIEKGPLK